jgi:branched-chain amino acid transport system permease protein
VSANTSAVPLWVRPFAWIPAARRKPLALTLLAVVLLLFPLLHDNDADIDSAANAAAYATLALGLNIVVGMAGLLDLGYAAFFAIGAYAYGVATSFQVMPVYSPAWNPVIALHLAEKINQGGPDLVHFTVSFWLMLPISAVIAAAFGVLFGAPTLRLKGDYLAIVTLGFGEIVPIVARNWTYLTNGAMGMNGIAAPSLFGTSFGIDATPYYYVGITMVALLIFISIRLRDSRIGRAWMAIREDEIAAGAMGVNLVRSKLLAFAIGAGFAGMTGSFYVAKLQTATPEMFGFPVSVMILVMVVFGGLGSVWGVVLGAVILQLLQSWFLEDLTGWIHVLGAAVGSNFLQQIDLVPSIELIFGVILVVMMLYRRDGLIPATRRAAALTFDQQHAVVQRGKVTGLSLLPPVERPGTPLLEIKDVTVRFGGLVALNSINLVVPAGSVMAVIGPNGSGKSTMFNVITGLTPAASGQIIFNGADITGLAPHEVLARGLARTFQNIRLFPNLTVLENVMVGQHARLRTGPLRAVFRPPSTRLVPRLGEMVSGLSYANRRRVEISRALASRPRLLLLDEPTAGMNPAETLELAEQIKQLNRLGLTILLIEHKLDVVTRLADKVVVLDHGEKIAEGAPDEVRRNEAVLQAYLGRGALAAGTVDA